MVGICEMNGSEKSDMPIMSSRHRPTTGLRRASVNPLRSCLRPRVSPGARATVLRIDTEDTAAMAKRNVSALITKIVAMPCAVSARTPIGRRTSSRIGPMTLDPLSAVEFNEMTPGMSARSTSSGRTAWNDGWLSALATPEPNTHSTRPSFVGWWMARKARTSAETSCALCALMIRMRRGRRLARKPPTTANTNCGPNWANPTSATNVAEPRGLAALFERASA